MVRIELFARQIGDPQGWVLEIDKWGANFSLAGWKIKNENRRTLFLSIFKQKREEINIEINIQMITDLLVEDNSEAI